MIRHLGIALLALGLASACGIGDAQQRLRTAVDAKRGELDGCYTAALARDESIEGQLDATVHVDRAEARVESVEFTGGDVSEPQLQQCFSDVLTGVRLEDPPAANLQVSYSFRLSPREGVTSGGATSGGEF